MPTPTNCATRSFSSSFPYCTTTTACYGKAYTCRCTSTAVAFPKNKNVRNNIMALFATWRTDRFNSIRHYSTCISNSCSSSPPPPSTCPPPRPSASPAVLLLFPPLHSPCSTFLCYSPGLSSLCPPTHLSMPTKKQHVCWATAQNAHVQSQARRIYIRSQFIHS